MKQTAFQVDFPELMPAERQKVTLAPPVDRQARLRRLTFLFDEWIRLPGGYRVGLDGLLGLIPGVGDLAGAAVSTYIFWEAIRMGASKRTLLRMALNILIDFVVGAIPLLGDVFDVAWKANVRNLRLLEKDEAIRRH